VFILGNVYSFHVTQHRVICIKFT